MKRKKRVRKRNPKLKRINQGYVQIKVGVKWMFEHRLVCENFIGRELTPEETVHHINGNKENNFISNLMIFATHSEHMKFEIYFDRYGFNQRVRRMIQERWKPYLSLKN